MADPEQAELDLDIRAVLVDGVVSVTPLSLDLTARVDLAVIHDCLQDAQTVGVAEAEMRALSAGS